MFQSLRQNSPLYVLHKHDTTLTTGSVTNVTPPYPKWPGPNMINSGQEMVVDIVVKVDGEEVTYQRIPATLDIADFENGGIVLTDNKEAMNAEIANLKQKSIDIINSVDYHKQVVENCDNILNTLNPEYAERQMQQNEIKTLKEQVRDITKNITDLIAELRDFKKQ